MWVGLIQSVEGLNRTKRLGKRGLLLPGFLELGHQSFPAFRLQLEHQLFLGLEPAGFQVRTYTTGFPGSPACRQQILGLLSLPNCVNQLLTINLFLYVYIHLIGCVSL